MSDSANKKTITFKKPDMQRLFLKSERLSASSQDELQARIALTFNHIASKYHGIYANYWSMRSIIKKETSFNVASGTRSATYFLDGVPIMEVSEIKHSFLACQMYVNYKDLQQTVDTQPV